MTIVQVISDIHGHYSKLLDAVAEADNFPYDYRIFIGDYLDRAPIDEEMKMIEWMIDNQSNSKYKFLIGNHDLWCWDFCRDRLKLSGHQIWRFSANGGEETYQAILKLEKKRTNIRKLLDRCYSKMMRFYEDSEELPNFFFTHSGFSVIGDSLIVTDEDLWGGIIGNLMRTKDNSSFVNLLPNKYKDYTFVIGHWMTPNKIDLISSGVSYDDNITVWEEPMPHKVGNSNVYLVDNGCAINKNIGLKFFTFNIK